MQEKISVFSDRIGLFVDKYDGFVDKKKAPNWAPTGLQTIQAQPKTMKTHRGGCRGEQRAPLQLPT